MLGDFSFMRLNTDKGSRPGAKESAGWLAMFDPSG
jgi:hypothetical protein